MIVAFANNQSMSTLGGGATSILFTDPVPMGDANQAAAILNVEYIFGTSPSILYQGQASNDGTNWVDVTPLTDSKTTAGVKALAAKLVDSAFIRFRFEFSATTSGTAGVCFDLHVRLDHA